MIIILFILSSLFLHDDALAGPLPIPHPTLEIGINPDKFVPRSPWNIIWSCLSTVFICLWVVVHPNIPGPSESMFLARMKIMGCMLIAPELVIVWAGRQWFAARHIASEHKDEEWTITHGFLVSMGGFMLYNDGAMARTLNIETLEEYSRNGTIDWPRVTKKEIDDRSKGDFLSKSIAVLQTTWFIVQCLARGIAKITLTQMELATLAFSVLNIILCILWWNKPLGVAYPFPVYYRSAVPSNTPILKSPSSPLFLQPSTFTRFRADLSKRFKDKGIFAPIYILIIDPFILVRSSVKDLITCDTVPLSSAQRFRVPTFYAPPPPNDRDMVAIFMGLCVGVVFGGIHCVGWSFGFITIQEEYIWRTSAATITAIPLVVFFIVDNTRTTDSCFHHFTGLRSLAIYILIVLYCVSRVALLALPTLALRSLPPEALLDFDWSSFIPHL